jgi:hypothetical protein
MKTLIKATDKMRVLAHEAYMMQNASNLCGHAQSFAGRMIELGDEGGTSLRNQHPITVLWIDKFASLAGCQHLGDSTVTRAYHAVFELRHGRDVEWEYIA